MTISLLIDTSGGSDFEGNNLRNVGTLHVGGSALATETLDVTGTVGISSILKVNTVNEFTGGSGVTIDGVVIKDSGATFAGDVVLSNGFGIIIGHTALLAVAETTPELQILGTAAPDSSLVLGRYSADINPASLRFYKSRAAIGSLATVVTGDELGAIRAYGDDGTDADTRSSAIIFDTEGTISTGQVPGIIRIQVAAAGTLADALVIDSTRGVGVGSSTTGSIFAIEPGIAQRDMVTSVGLGLHIAADTWDINTAGNSETKAIGTLAFFGIPTWTSTGTSFTVTIAATVYIEGPPVGSTNVTLDSAPSLWVDAGDTRLDGNLLLPTSGSVINFNGGDMLITHSSNTLTVSGGTWATAALTASTIVASGIIKTDDTTDATSTTAASLQTDGGIAAAKALIVGTKAYINDTANANSTIGLTINQSTNDNEIFSLKSSTDVDHGLTGTSETDTFFTIKKALGGTTGSGGGTRFFSVMADTAGEPVTFAIHTYGGTASTTKTTGGRGLAEFFVGEHDGANTVTNITANGNIFAIRAQVGGTDLTRFLLDEDGDIFTVTVVDVTGSGNAIPSTAFDSYDDALLVRALDVVRTPAALIRSEWDAHVRYHEQDLIDANILGATIDEGGMTNITQLQRLHNGAIWQAYTERQEIKTEIEDLRDRLQVAEKKLTLLAA